MKAKTALERRKITRKKKYSLICLTPQAENYLMDEKVFRQITTLITSKESRPVTDFINLLTGKAITNIGIAKIISAIYLSQGIETGKDLITWFKHNGATIDSAFVISGFLAIPQTIVQSGAKLDILIWDQIYDQILDAVLDHLMYYGNKQPVRSSQLISDWFKTFCDSDSYPIEANTARLSVLQSLRFRNHLSTLANNVPKNYNLRDLKEVIETLDAGIIQSNETIIFIKAYTEYWESQLTSGDKVNLAIYKN